MDQTIPLLQRVPSLPWLFDDLMRAYRGNEYFRNLHLRRPGTWLCKRHGNEDPVSYTHLDVYKRQTVYWQYNNYVSSTCNISFLGKKSGFEITDDQLILIQLDELFE